MMAESRVKEHHKLSNRLIVNGEEIHKYSWRKLLLLIAILLLLNGKDLGIFKS